MKKTVLFAVAVVIAGCGRDAGLRTGNTKPTGDAAVFGTGGMVVGGNAGASGAAASGGSGIAGSIATGSVAADAATSGGGAIATGGSSVGSGGTGSSTTGSGGTVSSGGRVDASGGTSSTSAGGSVSGGSAGGGFSSASDGGSASGGDSGGRGGSSAGTSGGATAGAGGSTGGAAGNGGTSGAGGVTGGCNGCQSLEQCWNGRLCVARSVSVPAGFAIDATEVTRAQYAAWLATNPSTDGQAGLCSWNASFTPDATCMAESFVCQGTGCANHPQPCVDMCDAAAYCAAVGKRLCGGISGGPVSSTAVDLSLNIASKSQWYNACTSNGVNQFTYGNSAVWGNCNDYLSFSKTTVPVASMPECQSPIPGYAGVFDLIGNLSEWEDNCYGSAGQADMCTPRGFSFGGGAAMPVCNQYTYANRAAAYATIGFRCCVP